MGQTAVLIWATVLNAIFAEILFLGAGYCRQRPHKLFLAVMGLVCLFMWWLGMKALTPLLFDAP